PCRAAYVGTYHEGALWGAQRVEYDVALPYADSWVDAHRSTTARQCRSHDASGVGSDLWWYAVAPYKRLRRGVGSTNPGGRDIGVAHAANYRLRKRHHRHC